MKWLLQKNIWEEYSYDRFENSIKNNGIDYDMVHVVPFTENFDKDIDFVPNQIFGSNRFVNVCRSKGYPTFKSFDPIESKVYNDGDIWLNGNCYYVYWESLKSNKFGFRVPIFLKPKTEKFFTGKVVYPDKPIEDQVQLATSFIEDENLELIQVCPVRDIIKEARFFIIGGKVVSGSYYRVNGEVKYQEIERHDESFGVCVDILERFGAIDQAFVMDLGLDKADLRWRIVELNNINSAGFYACDTDAIVNAFKNL